MRKTWESIKSSAPPCILLAGGLVWGGIIDHARGWMLTKVLETPYMAPIGLILAGLTWLAYNHVRPPQMIILCEPSHHPFRQEWNDQGGHQILFRIGVHNKSRLKGINRAIVQLTAIDPFDMLCIPARLLLMNEDPSAREFFLPASGTQYVDVIQQSQPSGETFLWHIVKGQPLQLQTPKSFSIEITAYGDNTDSVSQRFNVVKEGTVFALKAVDRQ